jgi:hypothetical protein
VLILGDLRCPEIVQVLPVFCFVQVEGDSARRPGRQLKKEKRQPKLPFSKFLPEMNSNLGRESVQETNWTQNEGATRATSNLTAGQGRPGLVPQFAPWAIAKTRDEMDAQPLQLQRIRSMATGAWR